MAERPLVSLLAGGCAAAGSSIAVGSSVAASSRLTEYPIAFGQALRYALAALLLLALVRFRPSWPRLRPAQWLRLAALAAVGLAGFNFFLIAALRGGDAGTVGAIVGAVPVVLALAGPLSSRRAPSPGIVAAAAVVVAGAAIVHGVGGSMPASTLLWAILAMLCECGFSLLAVPLLDDLEPAALSMWVSAVAAVVLFVHGLAFGGPPPLPTGAETAAIGYLALVPTAGAFVLWYSSLSKIPVETAGLFAGLIPIAAMLTSVAVGATTVTFVRAGGALLIGGGVVLGVLASRRATVPRDPPERHTAPVPEAP
ncbi:DMT family transporter [Spirillospora sp. NPDC029432]|uniref:DMT family transporter n=1 Tax=Spirillospora sp. NPDC029432 TaxID=3154599 RepID=UPI003451ABFB